MIVLRKDSNYFLKKLHNIGIFLLILHGFHGIVIDIYILMI